MASHSIGPGGKVPSGTVYSVISSVVSRIPCHSLWDSLGSFQRRMVRVAALPSSFFTIQRSVTGFEPSTACPTGAMQIAWAVLATVEKV